MSKRETLTESMRRLSDIVNEEEQLDEIGGIIKQIGKAIQTSRKNAGLRVQKMRDVENISLDDVKKKSYLASLSKKQRKQLLDEITEVRDILNNMSKKGQLNKMTDAERSELAELLANKYPMYGKIYGDIMPTVPRYR